MQISKILMAILALGFSQPSLSQSTGHIGHGGNASESGCIRAKVSRIKPEHLSSVAPGSEFSFAASGSNGPGHIHVSIKQQAVPITVEDKDTFYLVKGKLPADIKNTTVRVSVSLKAKFEKCSAEEGWLLKVSD
ncbi:hypothetical protein ACH518_07535 [Methylomonas sp. HW2-6]|uniref:hypothetical protein n=1 Tax=Methylomonas TaxID=416 RepID=UPI00112785C6|nr:hypothetical protein [Methylomonas koyamae]TPQ29323.1 hypothetical protein C2U68_02420 [Methylomonas koyamae]